MFLHGRSVSYFVNIRLGLNSSFDCFRQNILDSMHNWFILVIRDPCVCTYGRFQDLVKNGTDEELTPDLMKQISDTKT